MDDVENVYTFQCVSVYMPKTHMEICQANFYLVDHLRFLFRKEETTQNETGHESG